jgi:hypothetical protein
MKFETDYSSIYTDIKQNMLELVCKHVTYFKTDLIIDFVWLDKENEKGTVPDTLYFICRESGVHLGELSSNSTFFYFNENVSSKNDKMKIYRMDMGKASDIDRNKLSHSSNLSDPEDENCCFYLMTSEEIKNTLKEYCIGRIKILTKRKESNQFNLLEEEDQRKLDDYKDVLRYINFKEIY